jgi:hypothetical protein
MIIKLKSEEKGANVWRGLISTACSPECSSWRMELKERRNSEQRISPYVTQDKIGATYWGVKEQKFGGRDYGTRGSNISTRERILKG